MTLWKGKVQSNKFKKRTFEVSIKMLSRKWDEETLLKWFSILQLFEKFQNEQYPDNLNLTAFSRCTFLHVLMLCISLLKKICNNIENDKLLKEKFSHVSWRQK